MPMAQWLPQSRRSGGEFITQNYVIPAGVNTAYTMLDVAQNDFLTPDLSVTADIQISLDNGQTWHTQQTVYWVGRDLTLDPVPPGKTPGFYAAVSGLLVLSGALIRVHFITVGTFRWGLLGELR